jgi:ribonuclease G
LRTELERDRTKTYVVEISPLGLVEMTRQNVTDGPREIMTKKCPTCGGDGIVLSETSAAVDIERRLRALAAGSRHQAYRVEVAAKVASILIGPGAARLQELERQTRRRFYLQPKDDTHLDHFLVLAEGKREELAPAAPVAEGAKIELKLVEVGLHDVDAGVGKVDGLDVCVGNAAKQVGKKVDVQVERVLDNVAYATLVSGAVAVDAPITAESEAEKPTRRAAGAPATARIAELDDPEAEEADEEELEVAELEDEEEPDAADPDADAMAAANGTEPVAPKKKTRRGSRGGRGRKKKTAAAPAAAGNGIGEPADVAPPTVARIHVPQPDLGEPDESSEESTGDGTEPARPKKKTRRGTRGGRGRKKKTAAAVGTATDGSPAAGPPEEEPPLAKEESPAVAEEEKPAGSEQKASDWEYVPMSQWDDV